MRKKAVVESWFDDDGERLRPYSGSWDRVAAALLLERQLNLHPPTTRALSIHNPKLRRHATPQRPGQSSGKTKISNYWLLGSTELNWLSIRSIILSLPGHI
jgi:hypothetical protein